MCCSDARPRVSLVGAGPGDPGLLTVRAAELLRDAEVLLYDALASDEIVDLTPPDCERIFVGKRGGDHAMSQSEIEALMLRKAAQGKRVVRLKGGDPFVFGRGGEEAQTMRRAGVPFEIVPGITSAIAAPAYAGIPVTHREFNAAFTVVTGHEDPNKPLSTVDWKRFAGPQQTLVLLMAVGRLDEIARELLSAGLPPDHPAAVISNGTRTDQRTLVATLSTIAARAREAGLSAPAVVVVGEVVRLREEIEWFERSPLFGRRVLVTRPCGHSEGFVRALRAAGAQPVVAPTIEIGPPDDLGSSARALDQLSSYAWIVFTSQSGVRNFFQALRSRGKDARAIGAAHVAAIGPATAAALEANGVRADLVPREHVAESLGGALLERSRAADRMLIYRAQEARDVLVEMLAASGRTVDVAHAYKTRVLHDPQFAQKVEDCDILTFTSSSTVAGFIENLGGGEGARQAASGRIIACIGPVTAQSARDAGLNVSIVADSYTEQGLMQALALSGRS